MKSSLKIGCWTAAIAAGFLFFGAESARAQFRAAKGNQQAAKSGTTNPNLLRANFTRPVRQPMQTLNNKNANQLQGANQRGFNPYGMNPYGMNQQGYNPYGMNPYGMNQQGYNPYGMNPYGMMNQGGYPGMMYPGMMYPGFFGY